MEIFKDIAGYEGRYQIGNLGTIKRVGTSTIKEKVLKPFKQKGGYFIADLSKDGTVSKHLVHRLVATAFVDNPNNFSVVNHIDNNPSNSSASNLEWVTLRENQHHRRRQDRNKTSKYIGVSWYAHTKRWVADISVNGKQRRLGYFKNEDEAADAYKKQLAAL